MAAAGLGAGDVSLAFSLAGLILGLCLMLPGYVLGATGAGDVKLVAAVGALVGPGLVVRVVLYTALAGGVLALGVAMQRRRLAATIAGAASLATCSKVVRQEIVAARNNRFPYAPAIAVGTVMALAF